MKLFLASEFGSNHKEHLENFSDKKLKNSKIVYIPTAANASGDYDYENSHIYAFAKECGADFQVLELEKYNKIKLEKALKGVDMIWVGGGAIGYLIEQFKASGFDEIIEDLYMRDIVYVGSSAGSMVCSLTQNVGEWYIGEQEPGVSLMSGLGLIDFEIYPHYSDNLYDKIESNWKKGQLYLLKDGEVITIDNYKVNVIGEERIINK